ncbi:MAG: NAD-binding protein, partial [Actinomycetota bacterium]|nr:NAD-binding protein [Actinomycetota bacterium]
MRTAATHVVVVGRGLLGSAAARHLADLGARVTLVGP